MRHTLLGFALVAAAVVTAQECPESGLVAVGRRSGSVGLGVEAF